MSEISYQALRLAAENATPGEWCTDDYHGVIADAGLNANYYIASCSGPDNRANKRFIAAANPATVLALLDELEAVQKTSAARLVAIDTTHKMFQRERDRAEKAEKRIAELEAREVKLPELKMLSDYLAEVTMREREDILVGVRLEFFRALEEAGVKVAAAAGKGETS